MSCSAGAVGRQRITGWVGKARKTSWFFWLNKHTLRPNSGLLGAEPEGLGRALGARSKAPWDGQGFSDKEDSRSWTTLCCCWGGGGGGSGGGQGPGSEDCSSRAVLLQSVEEPSVWLLALWALVTELQAEREALSEVALAQVPLVPGFRGASSEKRSEETLGWWISMAAVVTTHTAGSGTPLSVREVTCS